VPRLGADSAATDRARDRLRPETGPVDTDERTALRQAIGCDAIPALVLGNSRAAR
jgi:hypothetical protein